MLICSNVYISILMRFPGFHKVCSFVLNLIKSIYGEVWLVTNVDLNDPVILTAAFVQGVFSKNDTWRHKEHFIKLLSDICTTGHWWLTEHTTSTLKGMCSCECLDTQKGGSQQLLNRQINYPFYVFVDLCWLLFLVPPWLNGEKYTLPWELLNWNSSAGTQIRKI